MLQQLFDAQSAQLPGPTIYRTGMINDDIECTLCATALIPLAATDEDHGMEWRVLIKLAVEEDVARERCLDIPGNEVTIPLSQGVGIGKLREGLVGKIA